MQGRGVTNYSTSKPSFSYSTSTTEFDDALLSRDIITMEQAMMAKGATLEEARRLVEEKRQKKEQENAKIVLPVNHKKDSDEEEEEEENEDDEFLKSFRQKRLSELQSKQQYYYGQIIPITRPEWTHQVNDASQHTWVVINLTAQNSSPNLIPQHLDLCTYMEQMILPNLAYKFPEVKFVSIPAGKAIENFPEGNLPTLFCYRHGVLKHQLVGLQELASRSGLSLGGVEWRLGKLGVLESELEDDPREIDEGCDGDDDGNNPGILFSKFDIGDRQKTTGRRNSHGQSRFNGGMATLATQRRDRDDESDYDDVD